MKRNIDRHLLNWKESSSRKVLLLRGARQVGKTFSIRALGREFKNFLEVNFEIDSPVKDFFIGSLDPSQICQKLSVYYSVEIIEGETLLFFDEIQECPDAMRSLRFFYEKMPALHVAAAGSLLEFAISEIPSQGVGRLNSYFMYPLSFDEFLEALGENLLITMKNSCKLKPLEPVFHNRLIDYLKTFYIIGGMPEIVQEYVNSKNILACRKKLNDIIETFRDDFAKYKKRSAVVRLNEVFESIAFQAGNKFKYSKIDSLSAHNSLKDALELIIQAGLAYKVYHTSAEGIPLGAQIKIKKFKVVSFDTGIHLQILGLDVADIIAARNLEMINKGSVAELFVGLELIKAQPFNVRPKMYYWHKEKKASNAEIDYVIQKNEKIIPIEVKSGLTGKMQSMRIFMNEKNIKPGVRCSLENFSNYENIKICPLYAVKTIQEFS